MNYCKMLISAASSGNLRRVKRALSKEVDPAMADYLPIKKSISGGHFDVVKFLCIKRKYCINTNKSYILEESIKHYNLDITRYLIANGESVNHNYEIIIKALENEYFDTLKYLVPTVDSLDDLKKCINEINSEWIKYLDIKESELLIASRIGDLEGVKSALNYGEDIHTEFDSAIRLACSNGYLEIVKYLLEKGADIHVDNEYPLRVSAENGFTEIVDYLISLNGDADIEVRKKLFLLKNGADISMDEVDTLRWAGDEGHLELIKMLVDSGLDPDDYRFAILHAAEKGHLHILNYFFDNNLVDFNSFSEGVIRYAAIGGQLEIIKLFMSKGAEYGDNNAFELSAEYGHMDVLKFLEENGAVNKAEDYNDALHEAASQGRLDIVKYLISKGADIHYDNDKALNSSFNSNNFEVSDYLISIGADVNGTNGWILDIYANDGDLKVVKYLVKNGVNIHLKNESALGYAAKRGHTEIVKYLVSLGADIYACNAMSLATSEGQFKTVKYLVELGADIHFNDNEGIINCFKSKNTDLIKYYIEQGADVKAKNNSPICYAAEMGDLEIVKMLLERGADINPGRNYMDSPLRASVINGNRELIKFLLENGAKLRDYEFYASSFHVEDVTETVKYVYELGYGVYNLEALQWFSLEGELDMFKLIVSKGVKLYDGYRRLTLSVYDEPQLKIIKFIASNNLWSDRLDIICNDEDKEIIENIKKSGLNIS